MLAHKHGPKTWQNTNTLIQNNIHSRSGSQQMASLKQSIHNNNNNNNYNNNNNSNNNNNNNNNNNKNSLTEYTLCRKLFTVSLIIQLL